MFRDKAELLLLLVFIGVNEIHYVCTLLLLEALQNRRLVFPLFLALGDLECVYSASWLA